MFPDKLLPVPFDDKCLDDVEECWDLLLQRFSHFLDAMIEKTVQNWLNHLAHTHGVKHSLIQRKLPEELTSNSMYEGKEEVKEGVTATVLKLEMALMLALRKIHWTMVQRR